MRSRQLGIVKFWNKIDGKEETPKAYDLYEFYYRGTIHSSRIPYIKKVLDGDHEALLSAFSWGCTPWLDYWHKRCGGQVPLCNRDIAYLEWLIQEIEEVNS